MFGARTHTHIERERHQTLSFMQTAKGAKIKISLFNFELTFNGSICKKMVYLNAHYSVLWEIMGQQFQC